MTKGKIPTIKKFLHSNTQDSWEDFKYLCNMMLVRKDGKGLKRLSCPEILHRVESMTGDLTMGDVPHGSSSVLPPAQLKDQRASAKIQLDKAVEQILLDDQLFGFRVM